MSISDETHEGESKREYVLGFALDLDDGYVLLILKNKPEWQKGRLNAVGGKLEEGELPQFAMVREFYEETGIDTPTEKWKKLCLLDGPGFVLHVFQTNLEFSQLKGAHDLEKTGEEPLLFTVPEVLLGRVNTLPNVSWLLAMAISLRRGEKARGFKVSEVNDEAFW